MALVILGGGIIGLSVAYYTSLAQPGRKIIIVDSNKELLQSSSGFSGGYIVRDWFSTDVLPLADLSYRLHKDLANSNNGRNLWGYSESIAYSLVMEDDNSPGKKVRGEDWLLTGTSRAEVAKKYVAAAAAATTTKATKPLINRKERTLDPSLRPNGSPLWANIPPGGTLEQISSPDGCAQVEPRQLCQWLISQCQSKGVEFILDTQATDLLRDHKGKLAGLCLEPTSSSSSSSPPPSSSPSRQPSTIPCKDLVIAAGSWTPRVYRRLLRRKMEIGMRPLPGYSIVVRSPRYHRPIIAVDNVESSTNDTQSHAVFYPPHPKNWTYSPEAMARMNPSTGNPEIFVAGLNDETLPLPRVAGDVKKMMDPEKMGRLRRTAVALTGGRRRRRDLTSEKNGEVVIEDDLEVVREALCFRPVSESGVPVISRVGGGVGGNGVEGGKDGDGGVYVASGHGPWGVSLSLGTGLVVAEMVSGVRTSVDLDRFKLPERRDRADRADRVVARL